MTKHDRGLPSEVARSRGAKDGAGRLVGAGRRKASKDFPAKVEAVMSAAERSGLTGEKSGRIGGRVSLALVRQAKARTGIDSDTDLIAFALANVALEDSFPEAFKAARGKVDPELKLGF